MTAPTDLMPSDEACRHAGRINRRTLGRWFELGWLTAYRVVGSRHVWVSRRELDDLLRPRPVGEPGPHWRARHDGEGVRNVRR